jgi:DNA-damage-inducible protein D
MELGAVYMRRHERGEERREEIMAKEIAKTTGGPASPFERIKRTNDAGMEFWSGREFSEMLGYGDYRNFEGVIEKAKLFCFNSGHRIDNHFVDVTEMIEIGKGAAVDGNSARLH